jgi:putative endonuclease
VTRSPRQALGRAGEELAATALAAAGLTVVARNWRCRYGELDLIAQESAPDLSQGGAPVPWLVIVEVRTRRGTAYGSARESVNAIKQAKLRTVAAAYVQEIGWSGPWRIDVVAVQLDGGGRLIELSHIRHAVTG